MSNERFLCVDSKAQWGIGGVGSFILKLGI